MSLDFSITSVTHEADGPDGWVYKIVTTLDFHLGWYTRLIRTKRSANGYPLWHHGAISQSLRETGEWTPNCAAQPIRRFDTFDTAAAWLEDKLKEAA